MLKQYINIADIDYYATKGQIKTICSVCGFEKVVFSNYNINGQFRKGYIKAIFKGNFRSFAEKLKSSQKVKLELNKLEGV